ncbi:REP-associated tyrosine transposase [Pseudomonas sp. TUM22785]|uniref:REP-associated tyrosine transposase n=1 Tax=Pseudomonas sp. TUM22785 TaxID=3019098 RepID=UPI00230646FF|nr:transposase [Pseudomonas sp. TUM22785]WCD80886.1 transposase [Pseudomonas sp. TUM22785]
MGSRDLRKGRVSELGRVYLITATTAERRPLFADFARARLLVDELRRLEQNNLAQSLAWVVMPDHFHWLMRLSGPMPLSSVVKALKGRTARRLGPLPDAGGKVWQPGFHDRALRHEDELLPIARYVVANPLRAGLVQRLGDYPHWDAVWL